jgi:hypothetical protein
MKKWNPPHKGKELREFLLEKRGQGKTWRKIAAEFGIARSTLYDFFTEHKGLKESIDKETKEEVIENLRSTAVELAIKEKNPTMLIYLLKALAKLYDQPRDDDDSKDQPKEELHPAMTRERWQELHRERQKKKCVP